MSESEHVEVIFERVERDSDQDNAILFRIDGKQVWVPRSLVGEIDREAMTAEVADWFAHKEGLV